jgi:hypothetical protein
VTQVGVLGTGVLGGASGHNFGAGFYYYDMPVAINGKQMGLPNSSYAKQERNNIKKGGSTGGLLLA